jgi:hypothetical protein
MLLEITTIFMNYKKNYKLDCPKSQTARSSPKNATKSINEHIFVGFVHKVLLSKE